MLTPKNKVDDVLKQPEDNVVDEKDNDDSSDSDSKIEITSDTDKSDDNNIE